MSSEAKKIVQAGLDVRREARQAHIQDMEVIGVIDRKHEVQRQQATEAMNQAIQARAAEEEARRAELEAIRAEEEARQEEEAQCRRDFRLAAVVAVIMAAFGAVYMAAPHNPDLAYLVGGLLIATAMTIVGVALACWRWSQW